MSNKIVLMLAGIFLAYLNFQAQSIHNDLTSLLGKTKTDQQMLDILYKYKMLSFTGNGRTTRAEYSKQAIEAMLDSNKTKVSRRVTNLTADAADKNDYTIAYYFDSKKINTLIIRPPLAEQAATELNIRLTFSEQEKAAPEHDYDYVLRNRFIMVLNDSAYLLVNYKSGGNGIDYFSYDVDKEIRDKAKRKMFYAEVNKGIKPPAATVSSASTVAAAAKPNTSFYKCVSGGCTEGWGKATLADTKFYYEGLFKNGTPNGAGKIVFTDKAYAQGNFVNGELHGSGMFDWGNGRKYIGDFRNGVPHGEGTYFDGGDYYEGPVKNGELTCATCWKPKRNTTKSSYVNGNQWLLESIDRQRQTQQKLEEYQNAPTWFEQYQKRNY